MVTIDDLIPAPGERTIAYGGSRTGKSSHEDWIMRKVQEQRPESMILLMDTKPRFRAESIGYGPGNRYRRSVGKLYESWSKGPTLPNSVIVDLESENPLAGLWDMKKHPGEIAIMQSSEPHLKRRMLEIARSFMKMNVKARERLVVVDEGLDFYQRNSLGIDSRNDVIMDIARAGGERNIGLFFLAHRPHGIPPLLNMHSTRIVLFHLRNQNDMRYLWDVGVPSGRQSPEGDYLFDQYVIQPGGTVSEPLTVKLKLPDWYLAQLATT